LPLVARAIVKRGAILQMRLEDDAGSQKPSGFGCLQGY